jgi:flagellar basal body rod protein FlgC
MKVQFRLAAVMVAAFAAMTSCSPDPGDNVDGDSLPDDTIDVSNFKVKGQNFMMPSPMQIASMIQKSGSNYNKSMLNPVANSTKYTESMKQALNLGVYGADLGYITMYSNTQDALEYYKTVNTLADQLKITASFDPTLLKRFSDNIANKDSIMSLTGEAFRRSDNFLRDSEQDHLATLILAGGWIESMYFALNTYKANPTNTEMSVRIGEQKTTSAGLLKLLVDSEKPEFAEIITMMQALDAEYQKVEIKYTFADPTHDEGAKTTTIKGTTEVKISPELLASLLEKVTAVRNYIVN